MQKIFVYNYTGWETQRPPPRGNKLENNLGGIGLRSLFFFFFFFSRQSPKFVDFWHFCNLFCLSMIKVQFYNVFWNFFLKLCSFFKRFLFLQKFSILHSHLLSFQMKFNTPYVLPNFGIQSIIFQNFQVFSKHLYLLLLKSILSKIFAAILLCI